MKTPDVHPKYQDEKVYQQLESLEEAHWKQTWDVIIIGSGMAGLSCAAALSLSGKKVLVLERHHIPGGYTHMFRRKEYVWDVGVHAIGEMGGRGALWKSLDWLSQGQLKWKSLGENYDEFHFPENLNISFPNSKQEYIRRLKEAFPAEASGIDRYFALIDKAANSAKLLFALKSLPQSVHSVANILTKPCMRNWWGISCENALREIHLSEKLKTVLTAQWGYHGNLPKNSPFAMHALIVKHFLYGAYYPEGGSKNIAATLGHTINQAGGQIVCRASVEKLLMKSERAIGVELVNGQKIYGGQIISATSAKITVEKLIPKTFRSLSWAKNIKKLKQSPGYVCLYLGFKGDIQKAGASATNKWFFNTFDRSQAHWNLQNPNEQAHILYVSFPSLKDPLHDPGEQLCHTGEVVTFVPFDCFEKWHSTLHKQRPQDHEDFKAQIKDRLLAQMNALMPDLMKMLDFVEVSTPLTAEHYVNAPMGAIYGLESSLERFACKDLRTRTPLTNFYMTGVDVATTGVTGALVSGLLTAATLEPKIYPRLL